MKKAVYLEIEESIAIIKFNRPERYNAVNQDVIDCLNECFDEIEKNEKVRSIVITGFCSGADMSVFDENVTAEQRKDHLIKYYQPLINRFTSLNKPIIGAVNGTAAGVGAALALACDLRIMGERSAILYAFINIGLGPDGGASWLLARQVGYSKALEIAISGKKIMAFDCLKLGLTNRVVSDDKILNEAKNWAHELSKKPTLAIGITKADMIHSLDNDLNATIAFEAVKQIDAFKSYDLKEGVTAFIEKRPAKFKGK